MRARPDLVGDPLRQIELRKPRETWRAGSIALRGIAALVLGVLTVWKPEFVLVSLIFAFGLYAIFDGVFGLMMATQARLVGWIMVRALVSVIAGVVVIAWPGITADDLMGVVALWAMVSGFLEIVMAIRYRNELEHESLLVLEGALSIVFGGLLIVSPPENVFLFVSWLGAFLLVVGVILIVAAFRIRSRSKRPPEWSRRSDAYGSMGMPAR